MAFQAAPVMAVATHMLGGAVQAEWQALARKLRPQMSQLETVLAGRLRRHGYDSRQCKALTAITPIAAAGMLARGKSFPAFLEQVNYSARRLAKLGLSPAKMIHELSAASRLLRRVAQEGGLAEAARVGSLCRQLESSIVLGLDNAYYRVREEESDTLYALFQAELESAAQSELLQRFLGILTRYTQAEASRLFLLDRETSMWIAAAGVGEGPLPGATPDSPALRRKLARPRHVRPGEAVVKLLLDPRWTAQFGSCWSVPLLRGSRVEGAMQFAFRKEYEWLPRELQLLEAAAERILQAADKAQLIERLADREAKIRELATRMLNVEESERHRISRELHDEAGQSLLCVRLQLEMIENTLVGSPAQAGLAEARRTLEGTIIEVRRLISDLSPAVLEHLGLETALHQMAARLRRVYPVEIRLRATGLETVPKRIARVVYRLAQECLNNACRHASARRLNISAEFADKVLRLKVEDDGVGFESKTVLANGGSFGLKGMRERVNLLGGEFEIRSRPGRGTRIKILLPATDGRGDGLMKTRCSFAKKARWENLENG